jgi:hypothetical protein
MRNAIRLFYNLSGVFQQVGDGRPRAATILRRDKSVSIGIHHGYRSILSGGLDRDIDSSQIRIKKLAIYICRRLEVRLKDTRAIDTK